VTVTVCNCVLLAKFWVYSSRLIVASRLPDDVGSKPGGLGPLDCYERQGDFASSAVSAGL